METVLELLKRRTRRDLQAVAKMHRVGYHTKVAKQVEVRKLHQRLQDKSAIRCAIRSLNQFEKQALMVLHNDPLPYAQYVGVFGGMRKYRPWRDDSPRHPWRKPISTTEKLWYLALIGVKDGQVYAPREVLDLLPLPEAPPRLQHPLRQRSALPRPPESGGQTQLQRGQGVLLTDIALLLGLLLRGNIKPRWERWLPLRFLRQWNSLVSEPEDLSEVRSELQTTRLKQLHFLAEAAGLVGLEGGLLKPTVEAWRWLGLDVADQWAALRVGLDNWELLLRYRLVAEPVGFCGVRHTPLSTVPSDKPPLQGGPASKRSGGSKGGVVLQALTTSQPNHQQSRPSTIIPRRDGLFLRLPNLPHLRPLAELLGWCSIRDEQLVVDQEATRRAAGLGMDAYDVARVLSALIGEPLPRPQYDQLEGWLREGSQLRLRQVFQLISDDAALLGQLKQDRHLRPMFGPALSPQHVEVRQPEALVKRLKRRGYSVIEEAQPVSTTDDHPAAYLWMAARVYRDLSKLVDLPVYLPAAILDQLAAELPAGQVDLLAQAADAVKQQVASAIDGYAPTGTVIEAAQDAAFIKEAVEQAHREQSTITIDYFSPGHGAVSRRTIRPVLFSMRGDAVYVEAWCQLAGAERTFRLDRIVRIVDEQPIA